MPTEKCPHCHRAYAVKRTDLSPREFETVLLVMGGMTKYVDVAAHMHTTEQVIKNRMSKVFRKLGIHSKVELAAMLAETPTEKTFNVIA